MQFRTLTASEIEARIGMVKDNGLTLLLYKNARVDKPKKNPLSEWDPTKLKKDIGFGFRVVVPMLGIIGFDFAWPLDPGESYSNGTQLPSVGDMEFNFVIGQAF